MVNLLAVPPHEALLIGFHIHSFYNTDTAEYYQELRNGHLMG